MEEEKKEEAKEYEEGLAEAVGAVVPALPASPALPVSPFFRTHTSIHSPTCTLFPAPLQVAGHHN